MYSYNSKIKTKIEYSARQVCNHGVRQHKLAGGGGVGVLGMAADLLMVRSDDGALRVGPEIFGSEEKQEPWPLTKNSVHSYEMYTT